MVAERLDRLIVAAFSEVRVFTSAAVVANCLCRSRLLPVGVEGLLCPLGLLPPEVLAPGGFRSSIDLPREVAKAFNFGETGLLPINTGCWRLSEAASIVVLLLASFGFW